LQGYGEEKGDGTVGVGNKERKRSREEQRGREEWMENRTVG
jgi:hypothetical protein